MEELILKLKSRGYISVWSGKLSHERFTSSIELNDDLNENDRWIIKVEGHGNSLEDSFIEAYDCFVESLTHLRDNLNLFSIKCTYGVEIKTNNLLTTIQYKYVENEVININVSYENCKGSIAELIKNHKLILKEKLSKTIEFLS